MTKTVTLGEICEINSGGTPSRSKAEFFNGNIPWAKISDIESAQNGPLLVTEESITEAGLKSINNRIFKEGTLLLAIYGSVGKVAIAGTTVSTNQAILGIRPKQIDQLDIYYLKNWFQFVKAKLLDRAVGGTLQNISLGIVKALPIPLPPLPEQRRIAALLDRADALRQKDRQLLAHYDKLAQSIFLDLFGDPVKNEKGWEVKKLGEVIIKIDSGWSPVCHERPRTNKEEWAVLKLGAVTSRYFKPNENKVLPDTLAPRPEIEVKLNDVLFSRKNTKELVGACVYIFENSSGLMMSDTIFRLVRNDLKINGIFLWYLINDKSLRQDVQKLATGSAGSMPNISKERLLDFKIPVPPLSLQTHFARLMEQIERQKTVVRQQMAASEGLFGRLLQECFG